MATRSGTPARTRLRTAVRRRSCGIRPGQPAFAHAALNAFTNVVMRRPFTLRFERLNTHGQITSFAFRRSCSAFCASRSRSSASVKGKVRPSSFFVVCGSRRTTDPSFEVDVPPLQPQHLARDPPAGDVPELDGRADRGRQVSEDAAELLPFEEA